MEYKIGFLILIAVIFVIPLIALGMLKRFLFGCPNCTWKGYWRYQYRTPEAGYRTCGRCGREEVEGMLGWSPVKQNDQMEKVIYSWFTPVLGCRVNDLWEALALDFDLVGYGDTPEEAVTNLAGIVGTQIKEAQEKGDVELLNSPSTENHFKLYREVCMGAILNEIFHCNDHGKEDHFCATLVREDFPLLTN